MPTAVLSLPSTDFSSCRAPRLAGRGISANALAVAIGSAASVVSSWLHANVQPSTAACRKLAEYFHEDPVEVFKAAGHLPESYRPTNTELPPEVTSSLIGLSERELGIVAHLAKKLREDNQDDQIS